MVICQRMQNIQFHPYTSTKRALLIEKQCSFNVKVPIALEYTKSPIPNDCIYA